MWKKLIYGKTTYDNFLINENGDIKNIKTNHIYKPYTHVSGYMVVTLPMGKRGKAKGIRVHKALGETFIPNPKGYTIVHHKNEDKTNYSLNNLEWTNNRGNTTCHLKKLSNQSSLFNNRKLTKQDIDFIRNNKGKISYAKMSKIFNVSKTTINNVVNNKFYNNGVW